MPGILVVAEQLDGVLREISAELVGAAAYRSRTRWAGLVQVLVIGADPDTLATGVNSGRS